MESNSIVKSALLMFIIVVASVAAWEIHLRKSGVTRTYNDGGPLWSDKRAQGYQPAQDIHVLVNPENEKLSPWYEITDREAIITPEWNFLKKNLKTWE